MGFLSMSGHPSSIQPMVVREAPPGHLFLGIPRLFFSGHPSSGSVRTIEAKPPSDFLQQVLWTSVSDVSSSPDKDPSYLKTSPFKNRYIPE